MHSGAEEIDQGGMSATLPSLHKNRPRRYQPRSRKNSDADAGEKKCCVENGMVRGGRRERSTRFPTTGNDFTSSPFIMLKMLHF